MGRAGALLLGVAVALEIAACGNSSDGDTTRAAPPGAPRRVALVTAARTDPFYLTLNAGAEARARQLGVTIDWRTPERAGPGDEADALRAAAASKPGSILIAPADSRALIEPLRQLQRQRTPVLTVDTDVTAPDVRLANITSDDERGGQEAAVEVARRIGAKGKVLLLSRQPGVTALDTRREAFERELKKRSGIQYLGVRYTQDDAAKTSAAVSDALQKDPDLAAVVAIAGGSAEDVAAAVAAAGVEDQVTVVTFGGAPAEVKALRAGTIDALLVPKAYDMGAIALEQAVAYVKDGSQPQSQRLDFVVADSTNLTRPGVRKYLYRPE
jgi:ribose transport system substrate-binding protein